MNMNRRYIAWSGVVIDKQKWEDDKNWSEINRLQQEGKL